MPKNVKLIIGSVREGRVSTAIAGWIAKTAAETAGSLNVEVVDLKEIELPLAHQPASPRNQPGSGRYVDAWRARVADADGFIFLTPEYNAGYPAALKNAIDYLYTEWQKPGVIVGYGWQGAGTSMTQLRQVLERIGGTDAGQVSLSFTPDMFDGSYQLKDAGEAFAANVGEIGEALKKLEDAL